MKRFGMFAIAALIGLFSFSPAHSQIVNPTNANNVLYTAPFTGASSETQAAKNAQVINGKDFGMALNGVTDDTAAFIKAISACVANNATLVLPHGNAKISETITFDVSKCRLYGDRTTLTWTAASEASAFHVQSSYTDQWGTFILRTNVVNRIEGVIFDATALTSKINVLISATAGGADGGVKFDRCAFIVGTGGTGVYIGNHAYLISFADSYFATDHTVDRTGTIGVSLASSTNAGENISFVGSIFDSLGIGIQIISGFVTLTNSTIDYFNVYGIQNLGGTAHLVNVNMETSADTNWLYATTSDGIAEFFLDNVRIDVVGTPPLTQPIFYVNNTGSLAGNIDTINMMTINSLFVSAGTTLIGQPNYNPNYLIGGNGKVTARGIQFQRSAPNWPTCASCTQIYDGTFSTAGSIDNWTVNTGVSVSGGSMNFAPGAGATSSASYYIPVTPGQIVSGTIDYNVTAITGAASEFGVQFIWVSPTHQQITAGGIITVTPGSSVKTETNVLLNYGVPAPKGAAYLRVFVYLNRDAAGTATATIDNINVTMQ